MSWTACVVRIHRKGKVESFLIEAEKFVFGRAPDCDFVFAESQISRQHLGILIRNGQIFLKDLGSANGTFQGSEQVPQDKVVPYKADGEIVLGTTQIHISLELLSKKIDEKALNDQKVPQEEAQKILSILETAKTRAQNLHQDFETLMANAQAEMQIESQAYMDAAKKRGAEIVGQAEAEAKKVLDTCRQSEASIIAAAKKEESKVVTGAQLKAEQAVAQIRAEANQRLQVSHEEAQVIIQEAQKKAQTVSEEAQKNALAAVQEAQRKAQTIIQEAQRSAQDIVDGADKKVSGVIAEAQAKAKEISTEAKSIAEDLVLKSKASAEEVTRQAEDFFNSRRKEAEASSQKILQEVQIQVDKLYAGFEVKKKEELEKYQKDLSQHKYKLDQDHKIAVDRLDSDFQLKNKMFEEECSIRRKQIEKEMQNEMERIADAKKTQESLLADNEKYQIELRKTLEEFHAADANLKKIRSESDEVFRAHEERREKHEFLVGEERRLQAELTDIVKRKENELSQIHSLKRKFEDEKSRTEKEAYDHKLKLQVEMNEMRQKESVEIQRMRIEELEKIDTLRRKTIDEIVKNKDVFRLKLAEKVEARVISLMKERKQEFDLHTFQREVLSLVNAAIEEQSFELSQGHEADIKHLVNQETNKRKSAFKKSVGFAVASLAVIIGIYIVRGGNIENILLGKNSQGETGAEEFGRVQREKRDAKKFEPPQSDFIKSNYTDNILYTRNYSQVYSDPQLQEKWIHELNRMFSKEFELDDDTIVKFVALESTLVGRLQQEKDQIVPDFAQLGIDKMRQIEKTTVSEMKALLKDPFRMRKFQAYSEKFWYDGLKERKPAADD
jgi:pSer/pThr/pTyr-binding forkhead associated (FHA) protein